MLLITLKSPGKLQMKTGQWNTALGCNSMHRGSTGPPGFHFSSMRSHKVDSQTFKKCQVVFWKNYYLISLGLNHMRKLLGWQHIPLKRSVMRAVLMGRKRLKMSFTVYQCDFYLLAGSQPGLTPSASSQVWQGCRLHCQGCCLHNYSM